MPFLHALLLLLRGKGQTANYMKSLCESIYDVNNQGDIRENYLISLRAAKVTQIRKVFL